MSEPVSFMSACMDYFGRKPGQSALEFKREIDALTDSDKSEIRDGLAALGFNIR